MTKQEQIKHIVRILFREVTQYEEPVVEQVARDRNPFKVLISTMLSLRTKDTTTTEASRRLFRKADTPLALSRLRLSTIERCIYPVGFYKTKAKHLRRVAEILIHRYNGKVPGKEADLLALPGVGRKTANLVLSLSFSQDAICVDTHVHRISNRFGLVRTKTPEETEQALMRVLPRRYWQRWNMWLVIWGQNICHPVSPRCSVCPLKPYCPQRFVIHSR